MKFLKAIFAILVVLITTLMSLNAKDIHVSKAGNDSNDGNETSPLFTISKAAIIAIAGDVVIVHQGTYREYINSPKGGTSDSNRIIFKVPFGEEVIILIT
jgi:alpha-N-arabinofuranosidase